MSVEADAIIKAACVQAAAALWKQTDLNVADLVKTAHVHAEKTAEFAVLLFRAYKQKLSSAS